MEQDNMFDNCMITTSQAKRDPNAHKAVWILNDLGHPETRQILLNAAKLNLEVKSGEGQYDLQFKIGNNFYNSELVFGTQEEHLRIDAMLIGSDLGPSVSFDISIQSIQDSTPQFKAQSTFHFAKLGDMKTVAELGVVKGGSHRGKKGIVLEDINIFSKSFRLGVIATPITCNTVDKPNSPLKSESEVENFQRKTF